ncbi:MAG: FAD-dependent oxidoreductase [Holdemania massiliensis]
MNKNAVNSILGKNYDKLTSVGVEVIDGEASFLDDHHVRISTGDKEEIIEAQRIFINTGAKPFVPDIAGLKESRRVYLSESLMELETLPKRLVILGGGYIGLEFASMFANFGSQVTLLQPGERFLPREDAEIAAAVEASLNRRGVRLMRNTALTEVRDEAEETVLRLMEKETASELRCDALLVATGRRPQLDALHPEAAGITLTARGAIAVDEHLKTSVIISGRWAMSPVVCSSPISRWMIHGLSMTL